MNDFTGCAWSPTYIYNVEPIADRPGWFRRYPVWTDIWHLKRPDGSFVFVDSDLRPGKSGVVVWKTAAPPDLPLPSQTHIEEFYFGLEDQQ